MAKKINVPKGKELEVIEALSEGFERMSKIATGLEKRLGDGHSLISRSNFTLWRLKTELVHTNVLMASIPAIFIKGIGDFNKLQIRALSLGTDIRSLGGNFKELENLPGGIDQAIESQFEMMSVGLDTNSKILTKHLVQAKLTGQDSQALADMLRRFNVQGGFSLKETVSLSQNMVDLNSTFGIQIDRLVNSMAGLEDVFSKFSIFGQGGQAAETFQRLVAKFGPGSEALVSKIIKNLTTGGTNTLGQASLLGIQGFRSKGFNLLNDPTAFEAMVKQGGGRFKSAQNQFSTGVDPFLMFDVLEEVFGPMGRDMAMLTQLMEENNQRGVLPLMKAQLQYNASFNALRDEVLKPFYESAIGVATGLMDFFISWKEWSVRSLQLLAIAAAGWTGGGMTQVLGKSLGLSLLGKSSMVARLGSFLMGPWGAALGAIITIGIGLTAYFSWTKSRAQKQEASENERRLAELSRENMAKEQMSFWKMSSDSIDRSVQNIIFMRDIMTELANHSGVQTELMKELLKHNRDISNNTEKPLHRTKD